MIACRRLKIENSFIKILNENYCFEQEQLTVLSLIFFPILWDFTVFTRNNNPILYREWFSQIKPFCYAIIIWYVTKNRRWFEDVQSNQRLKTYKTYYTIDNRLLKVNLHFIAAIYLQYVMLNKWKVYINNYKEDFPHNSSNYV